MKVRLNVTIEVDPKEWSDEYGCGKAVTKVDADVREYVKSAIWSSPAGENGLMTVEVTRV